MFPKANRLLLAISIPWLMASCVTFRIYEPGSEETAILNAVFDHHFNKPQHRTDTAYISLYGKDPVAEFFEKIARKDIEFYPASKARDVDELYIFRLARIEYQEDIVIVFLANVIDRFYPYELLYFLKKNEAGEWEIVGSLLPL